MSHNKATSHFLSRDTDITYVTLVTQVKHGMSYDTDRLFMQKNESATSDISTKKLFCDSLVSIKKAGKIATSRVL